MVLAARVQMAAKRALGKVKKQRVAARVTAAHGRARLAVAKKWHATGVVQKQRVAARVRGRVWLAQRMMAEG